jgi:nucleoside-triphosphatase THEP1
MASTPNMVILWTGPKHCGKTTGAAGLIRMVRNEGFAVGGILEPSLYDNGELVGFDVLDVRSGERRPLARRSKDRSTTGLFQFFEDGLDFGNNVLTSRAVETADIVTIDEFGPLELEGKGWRRSIDSLLSSCNAVMVTIIRQELKGVFQEIYADVPCLELEAIEKNSAREVLAILKNRGQIQ